MRELHVGSGAARGALTVFPVWGDYTSNLAGAGRLITVAEQPDGAAVARLDVTSTADHPTLLFEGVVLEGGWQNRMLARSFVLEARQRCVVDVVCVEQGRWGGDEGHSTDGRRGSIRLRSGLRSPSRQQEVWSRVDEYEQRRGSTSTQSFTDHVDRARTELDRLVHGLRVLPGQIGVLVAVAGQPVSAEVFANHRTLRREFDSIVRAAGLDALDAAPVPTPGRRARRFLDRAARVPVDRVAPAGAGWTLAGEDRYVQVGGTQWQGKDAHLVLTNPRHDLVRAGA